MLKTYSQLRVNWKKYQSLLQLNYDRDGLKSMEKFVDRTFRAAAALAICRSDFDGYTQKVISTNVRYILKRMGVEQWGKNRPVTRIVENFVNNNGHDYMMHALIAAGMIQ